MPPNSPPRRGLRQPPRTLEHDGRALLPKDWHAVILREEGRNLPASTIRWRKRAGWSDTQALGYAPGPSEGGSPAVPPPDRRDLPGHAAGEVPDAVLLDLIDRPEWSADDFGLFVAHFEGSWHRWERGTAQARHDRIARLLEMRFVQLINYLTGSQPIPQDRRKLCVSLLLHDLLRLDRAVPQARRAVREMLLVD